MCINGEMIDVYGPLDNGYVKIERTWSPGDSVELILPMPLKGFGQHLLPVDQWQNRFTTAQSCIAEEVDNPPPHYRDYHPTSSKLTATLRKTCLVEDVKGLLDVMGTDDWMQINHIDSAIQ